MTVTSAGGADDGDEQSGFEEPQEAPSVADVTERVGAALDAVVRQTREHPLRSAAVALGAGYLLGGGLFTRLTGRIVGLGVRLGFRALLVPFVTEQLVTLAQGMITPLGDAEASMGTAVHHDDYPDQPSNGHEASSPQASQDKTHHHQPQQRHPDTKERP